MVAIEQLLERVKSRVGVESARTEVIAHADPGYFSMDVSWQPRR